MLLEDLPECGAFVVAGVQGNLGDTHGAHSQLTTGALQADPPDVAGNVLARAGLEDPMKVRHRETGDGGQTLPIKGFVGVQADESLDRVDTLGMPEGPAGVGTHAFTIAR